jgi:hypothetical protein
MQFNPKEDDSLIGRLKVIPFLTKFVLHPLEDHEAEIDLNIDQKIAKNTNGFMDQIFSWIVRGAWKW